MKAYNKKEKGGGSLKKLILGAVILCVIAFGGNMFSSGGSVVQDEAYTSYKEVAEYINTYQELPPNYITSNEARSLGWQGGNPQNVLGDNVYIGGDRFHNREHRLPTDTTYYECDVDYEGDTRGVNRLVYTKDGDVYYTHNHYETFEQLY